MKTITIDGVDIQYDETLVRLFEYEDAVRIEAVSYFNKLSQMPEYPRNAESVIHGIKKESERELLVYGWKHRGIKPYRYMKSKFGYYRDEPYSISLSDGWFRYVSDDGDEMAPCVSRWSISYFNRLLVKAGLGVATGGSSHTRMHNMVELSEMVKRWYKMGLLQKGDWIQVESRYIGGNFTTTVGRLLGFGYAGDKVRYWNKWFRKK